MFRCRLDRDKEGMALERFRRYSGGGGRAQLWVLQAQEQWCANFIGGESRNAI